MPSGIPALVVSKTYASKIVATFADYGFQANGRQCYNGSITNGTATVTATDASFTSADIGKLIIVQSQAAGAPGTRYRGTISSITSGTVVVVTPTPTITLTSASVLYGSDDSAAWTSFINDMTTYKCSGVLPGGRPNANTWTGMSITSTGIIIPNGSTLFGEGRDYPLVQQAPVSGSSIILIGSLGGSSFVQVGDRNNTLSSAAPPIYPMEAVLCDMNIDAVNGAASAVYMFGRRARVKDCTIWRGTGQAISLNSQNSWLSNCRIGQQNQGHAINVGAGDCKITDNDIRQSGNNSHQIYVSNSQNVLIEGNHMYKAGGLDSLSSSYQGNNIYLNSTGTPTGSNCTANVTITGNEFDATYGAHVFMNVAAGGEMHSINLTGNHIFNNGLPDATFPVFQMTVAATGILHGVAFDNIVGCSNQNRVGAYTSLFSVANSGTLAQWSAHGNHGINCNAIFIATAGSALPDAGHHGNSVLVTNTASGTTIAYGNNAGTLTASGTGAQTAFTFNHGLAGTPTQFTFSPTSAAASSDWIWSATSTQITVTFGTAPVSGTNNVTATWTAKL